jgi:hypothetical protein
MGGVGDEEDEQPAEAERVIRHRMVGHEAALKLAANLGRPDALEPYVEETEHRLAEDEDILEEITPDDG